MKLKVNHCAEALAALRQVRQPFSPLQRLWRTLSKYAPHALAVVFTATLYFWCYGGNFNEMWMQRWFILMLGAIAVIALSVGKSVSWLFAPAVFFSLFSGLVTSFWFTRYDNAAMERIAAGITTMAFGADEKWTMQAVMRQDASRAIFVLVALMMAQRLLSIRAAAVLRTTLGVFALVQSAIVLWQWETASRWVPFFDNPSTCGAFIAIALWGVHGDIGQYFWGKWRVILRLEAWALGLAAIIAIKATTPLLALAGGIGAYVLSRSLRFYNVEVDGVRRWFSWKLVAGAAALLVALAGVGYLTQGPELWYDNSRFSMWNWTIQFWERQGWFSQLFGMGTGTMRTFMPIAEVEHDKSTGWYFWLHNDWLQWLPELGWFGWTANIVAALELFRRSLRWPSFAAQLAAFGAAMLTGFPLHIPVTVLLLLVIVRPFMEAKQLFPLAGRAYVSVTLDQLKQMYPPKGAK